MPFFGPLKGACPGLCPQKGKTTFFLIKMGDTFNDFTIKMEKINNVLGFLKVLMLK